MFNGSYLRACMKLQIVQKIRFSLHESRWTKAWCPGLVSGSSAKAQELVARIRGLVIQPQKLSVGAYFELSFLGCGFLIQLSNRSDSPRFRAPWKKIRQKYGTQQEPSLFKDHPLSYQYVCRILRFVKKLDFAFMSLGGPRHGARVWCLGRVPKHRNYWQEVEGSGKNRGPIIQPQKLSVHAYFELSFLGCGFLIHLSNRSDSPRFRAPWKKIRQKYDIQQEPSLFKGHPLSYQYGESLCSMVPT